MSPVKMVVGGIAGVATLVCMFISFTSDVKETQMIFAIAMLVCGEIAYLCFKKRKKGDLLGSAGGKEQQQRRKMDRAEYAAIADLFTEGAAHTLEKLKALETVQKGKATPSEVLLRNIDTLFEAIGEAHMFTEHEAAILDELLQSCELSVEKLPAVLRSRLHRSKIMRDLLAGELNAAFDNTELFGTELQRSEVILWLDRKCKFYVRKANKKHAESESADESMLKLVGEGTLALTNYNVHLVSDESSKVHAKIPLAKLTHVVNERNSVILNSSIDGGNPFIADVSDGGHFWAQIINNVAAKKR